MRSLKLAALFLCRSLGLFALARRRTGDRLRILCYHGFEISDEAAFRPKLFMKVDRFEERLETISRQQYNVLPLDDALERLYAGTLPRDAVAITVDDGFHAFCSLAVPRLRHHDFPATVYVTTYYVERANPIFRLVVQYMFWKAQPRTLRLEGVPWSEDRMLDLSDPAQAEQATWQCIDYGEKRCSEDERRAICARLGDLLGVPYADIVQSRNMSLMSPDELRALAASRVATELHTHRHSFPTDDRAQAEREIADNRAALARWVDDDPRHFCYPSGLWDERQWPWLEGAGVKSAATCVAGLNDRNTPRFALRRFLDGDNIHQLEFEAALSGFTDVTRGLLGRG